MRRLLGVSLRVVQFSLRVSGAIALLLLGGLWIRSHFQEDYWLVVRVSGSGRTRTINPTTALGGLRISYSSYMQTTTFSHQAVGWHFDHYSDSGPLVYPLVDGRQRLVWLGMSFNYSARGTHREL